MSRAGRSLRWVAGALTTAFVLLLTACGTGGPPPVTYVIGPPPAGTDGVEPLTGRPVVEVKPVLVPDYLDVSDLMVRLSDNVVAPSLTGRWGERLSVGVTRALALDLQRRLPGLVVTGLVPLDRPALQILIEIEAFEPQADGSVVLQARWRLLNPVRQTLLAGEHVSLIEPSTGSSDAAMVMGMSRAVDDLAVSVAAAVRKALARRGASAAFRSPFQFADGSAAPGNCLDRGPGRSSRRLPCASQRVPANWHLGCCCPAWVRCAEGRTRLS
jgi:uncharacterized protein